MPERFQASLKVASQRSADLHADRKGATLVGKWAECQVPRTRKHGPGRVKRMHAPNEAGRRRCEAALLFSSRVCALVHVFPRQVEGTRVTEDEEHILPELPDLEHTGAGKILGDQATMQARL